MNWLVFTAGAGLGSFITAVAIVIAMGLAIRDKRKTDSSLYDRAMEYHQSNLKALEKRNEISEKQLEALNIIARKD